MMSNYAEMETNAITTSSTGVTTTMLSLHRISQGTTPDSLRTVSGRLSTTGALVTPALVDSSGRDEAVIISSRVVVVFSKGMDMVVVSSGRDLLVTSSGKTMVVISSRRELVVISSGRVMGFNSNRNMVIISGRGRGRANGEAPGTSPPPGVDTYTTVYRADSVH